MDDIKEIKDSVKQIEKTLVENTIKLSEYNIQLGIHIQATKDLQARVKPIEDHVVLVRSMGWFIVRILCGVAGLITTLAAAKRLLP